MVEHAEGELELGDVCGVRRLRLGVGEAHGRAGVNQTQLTRRDRVGILLQLRLEEPGALGLWFCRYNGFSLNRIELV